MSNDVDIFRRLRALEQRAARLEATVTGPRRGDWTPVLQGTSTAGTFVYSRRVARYTLSGWLCVCSFEIVVSSVSAGATGNLVMTGVPFTAKNTTNYQQSGALSQWDLINLTAADYVPGISIRPNTTIVDFVQSGDNVTSAVISATTVVAGFFVRGAIGYEIEG